MATKDLRARTSGLAFRRYFTSEGVHPFDEVEWEHRDAVIPNLKEGGNAFEQRGVEFPKSWSQNATNIVSQKYFRGPLGTPQRESSVRQLIGRVVDTIKGWGVKDGYFASEGDADVFAEELTHILVHQKAAFNSPVWFNLGVPDAKPQSSACFILAVDDQMSSILNWYVEEGTIFKGGSGSGINLSTLRSSKEPLGGGGTASGPVSFMRGADASAGTIKCLHHDTPIVTDHGVVPIRVVRPGWLVATRFGYKQVKAVHDNGVRALVRVRTEMGDEVLCTPEHRFRVRGRDGERWREARDLRADDHVLVDLGSASDGSLQRLAGVGDGHHNEVRHSLPNRLDEGLAVWLGWVFGDGSITSNEHAKFVAVQVADEDELVERYQSLTRSVFGSDIHFYADKHADRPDASTSVRFSSGQVIRFLEVNGLRKQAAVGLRVPKLVQNSPAGVRAAFLAGLFEADGHVGNGYPWLSTVSAGLAGDVHRLLLSLGIPSHIGRIDDRRTALGSRSVYTVRIVGGEGVRRFAKLVGFLSERKSSLLDEAVARRNRSPYETQWFLPHVEDELRAVWEATSDQRLRRAIAPYCRYAKPRRMSLLRARALLDRFPDELNRTSLARFAEGDDYYVPVTVGPAGEARTFDLTVADAHEYLVHNLVTHNSGGKTRRAAKMVILNVDHPDVEEFIWCKAVEERKARVLRDSGFDMDLDGRDSHSTQYQNANNSVRVTDEFMQAYLEDRDWKLKAVTTGEPIQTMRARDLMRQIAQAAWECADPGMQYDTIINDWHTCPASGRINASNPCSEYMHLDNSACNLASLNLLKFLDADGSFDIPAFKHAVEIVFTAQEILVGNSSYPTEKIERNAKAFRQLGLGYANLGALLMARGLPYDSDAGRAWAGAITALMTGHAYATSARVAERMGPFSGYAPNRDAMLRVMRKHRAAADEIDAELVPEGLLTASRQAWDEAIVLGEEHGYRNAQASVLAPTGTIGLMMDCDTTGVEPDLALVKTKKLVGGGTMQIVNRTVPRALQRLGYTDDQRKDIIEFIAENNSVEEAPHLREEHYAVFDTAMGKRSIQYMGHVKMLGATQPFISGSISKTINMPEEVTVEDVEDLFVEGWRLGLKAVAIYRDNCKVAQPLSAEKKAKKEATAPAGGPVRRRLPSTRPAHTFSFTVGDADGYIIAGEYPEDGIGEIFLKVAKQGSTLAGIMDAFAISVSLGLQYGVPLEAYVQKFTNMRFEPSGITGDPDIRFATSLVDYIFRRLALQYLPPEVRKGLGVQSVEERKGAADGHAGGSADLDVPVGDVTEKSETAGTGGTPEIPAPQARAKDAPLCYSCGSRMQPAGSCYVCGSCGATSGCS